jgi:hypothetical protein
MHSHQGSLSRGTIKSDKLLLNLPKSPKPSKKKSRFNKSLPGFTMEKVELAASRTSDQFLNLQFLHDHAMVRECQQ